MKEQQLKMKKQQLKMDLLVIEDALETHSQICGLDYDETYGKNFSRLKSLLEKLAERDTPMLPIKLKWENTENYYYVCPKCEEMVARDDEIFCQDCGQRLDWRK